MRCQRKRNGINEELIRESLNKRNMFDATVASNNPKKLGYKMFKAINSAMSITLMLYTEFAS